MACHVTLQVVWPYELRPHDCAPPVLLVGPWAGTWDATVCQHLRAGLAECAVRNMWVVPVRCSRLQPCSYRHVRQLLPGPVRRRSADWAVEQERCALATDNTTAFATREFTDRFLQVDTRVSSVRAPAAQFVSAPHYHAGRFALRFFHAPAPTCLAPGSSACAPAGRPQRRPAAG